MDYKTKHPGSMPENMQAYKRTKEFTEETMPKALLKDHDTKEGVWALVHVLEGELEYQVDAWNHNEVVTAGNAGLIAPKVLHWVKPLGQVRFFIEFYSAISEEDQPHSTRLIANKDLQKVIKEK